MEQTYEQFGTFQSWKEISILIRRLEYLSKRPIDEMDDFWVLNWKNDCLTLEELTQEPNPFLEIELKKTQSVVSVWIFRPKNQNEIEYKYVVRR